MRQCNNRKFQHGFTRYHTAPGFTLIELLIVIGVLGVLAAGVFTALNVVSTLGKASLSKAKTFAASVENDLSISQVGKWSFEESLNPSKDTSGYGNDATWNGTVASKTEGDCGLGFKMCLQFNGSSYIQAISAFGDKDFKTIPFSISLWVNPSLLSGQPVLISIGSTTATQFTILLFISDSIDAPIFINWFRSDNASTGRVGLFSTNNKTLPLNTWSHIVITHNSTEPSTTSSRIYLNGNILPVAIGYGSWAAIQDNKVRIGAGGSVIGGEQYFQGLIDEVAIYNQALTAYQIQHLYAQGLLRHLLVQR